MPPDKHPLEELQDEKPWRMDMFWCLEAKDAQRIFEGVKNVNVPVVVLRKPDFQMAMACVNYCIEAMSALAKGIKPKPAEEENGFLRQFTQTIDVGGFR